MEVACDSFDVGCMSVGDTIQVSFVLKNTGGSPLYIEDVVPSCDCITAGFSREKVAMGDSTEIKSLVEQNKKSFFAKNFGWYS